MRYENVRDLSNKKFRRNVGIKRETFEKMLEILRVAYAKKHKKRGRKPKLSLEDQLLAALEYWREYRTYARIALDFGIDESNMYRKILWIEDVLIKDGMFSLPGKKELLKNYMEYKIIAIDSTETPIERLKKNITSGKKQRHTLKTQVVSDKKTKRIICTAFRTGKTHDFSLFKKSKLPINHDIQANLDSGYQGVYNFHKNSKIPKKKTKLHLLTKQDKANNHKTSKQRIFIENVIGAVKIVIKSSPLESRV